MKKMETGAKNSEEDFTLELFCEGVEGRNAVDEGFREDARRLCKMQGLDVDTREIIFLANRSGRVAKRAMAVFPIPEAMSDILFQISGYRFRFVLKIWESAPGYNGEAPYSGTLYHTLKFFRRNGKTRAMELVPQPEVCEWRPLLPYLTDEGYSLKIPNLFETALEKEGETTDDNHA